MILLYIYIYVFLRWFYYGDFVMTMLPWLFYYNHNVTMTLTNALSSRPCTHSKGKLTLCASSCNRGCPDSVPYIYIYIYIHIYLYIYIYIYIRIITFHATEDVQIQYHLQKSWPDFCTEVRIP